MFLKRYGRVFLCCMLVWQSGTLAACGPLNDGADGRMETQEKFKDAGMEDESTEDAGGASKEPFVLEEEGGGAAAGNEEGGEADDAKLRFGKDCIAEQTFEVSLSEYEERVWFVPCAPSDGGAFHMQIISGEDVLLDISGYVPEALSDAPFSSLDAVSFYDVNYDGNTDIVLVETYGSAAFAAVYYGYPQNGDGEGGFFIQETLSEALSEQTDDLTIPQIRSLLSDGKKNGAFSDYREAYEMVSRLCALESGGEMKYDLISFDADAIPELVAGVNGYFMSLYAFSDGTVHTLMDRWPYGAMGNAGYAYCPGKNSLKNENSDFAGAILYTTYLTSGSGHALEEVAQIQTYQFDDANQNGVPDENEQDSIGRYSVSYLDGRRITEEERASYDAGKYVYLEGRLDAEELKAELNR